jgi:hypothetical protein
MISDELRTEFVVLFRRNPVFKVLFSELSLWKATWKNRSIEGGVILYAYAIAGSIADTWTKILILDNQNTKQENPY